MKSVIAMLMALMMIFACTFGAFAEAAETAAETTEETAAEETGEEEPAAEPVVMYVGVQGGLMIREAADLNSKPIMAIMVNQPINVYAIEGKWAKVSFNWTSQDTVIEGYMWADYLSDKPVKIVKKTAAKKAAEDEPTVEPTPTPTPAPEPEPSERPEPEPSEPPEWMYVEP